MIRAFLCFLLASSYDDAYNAALTTGKPLVVGVGCAPPAGPWGTCTVKTLEGYRGPCIVVSVPSGGQLYWKATLPASASPDDIRVVLEPVRKYNPYRASLNVRSANC